MPITRPRRAFARDLRRYLLFYHNNIDLPSAVSTAVNHSLLVTMMPSCHTEIEHGFTSNRIEPFAHWHACPHLCTARTRHSQRRSSAPPRKFESGQMPTTTVDAACFFYRFVCTVWRVLAQYQSSIPTPCPRAIRVYYEVHQPSLSFCR